MAVTDVQLGTVAGGSSALTGNLATPEGTGPWPGVVAIHEAFGLDDVVRRQADRLAAAGYLALAPNLFSDGGAKRCVVGTMRAMFKGTGKPFADIEASRQWLLGRPECTGKVGIIGFCMGGGFALLAAPTGFDVASINYGMAPRDLDATLQGSCPIVASYGGKEPGAAKTVRRLEDTLTRLAVPHDVKLYPAAGHSFLNDAPNGPRPLRPVLKVFNVGPEPDSAADAWRRIETFFAQHLES